MKQNIDFYTKSEIDSKFAPSWTGTLEAYESMKTHDSATIYTTIDKDKVKQFLGDTELKSGFTTGGEAVQVLSGTAAGSKAGKSERIDDE